MSGDWRELERTNALRPPCLTCGDNGFICPDCIDGRVSIEQLQMAEKQRKQRELLKQLDRANRKRQGRRA